MYLSDRDLKRLLPKLDIRVERGFPAFDPEAQIATCSIDLRLGSSFWRPRKRKIALDLRKPRLFEVQPSRYYRRESLAEGQVIVIKPGQLLLAQTLEQFTVPNGHMFDLTGRSSFARLGLMVNVTGGHINPGWRGHMTLQLVNTSLRLFELPQVYRFAKLGSLTCQAMWTGHMGPCPLGVCTQTTTADRRTGGETNELRRYTTGSIKRVSNQRH